MATQRVLVYGGKGALGSTVVTLFKAKQWWVGSIDLVANEEAHANITVEPTESWFEQGGLVGKGVGDALGGQKVDAILCVAGGWAGGSSASKDFIKNCDMMWKQCVWTSTIAAQLAVSHLKEGGLLALPGAQAALSGTPGMIGYGMAKTAVHHLASSLAEPKSGLPANAVVTAVLPVTLDTPMNRKWMPKADYSSWTPLQTVAELFFDWAIHHETRPKNGSLVQLLTKGGKTELVPVNT